MLLVGIILIAFGVLYVVKPDLYRRWIWTHTDVLQGILTPTQYIVVMRTMGVIALAVGVLLVFTATR